MRQQLLALRLHFIRGVLLPLSSQKSELTDELAPFRGDVRQTLALLQQVQFILMQQTGTSDLNLAALAETIHGLQHRFGRSASLEQVIQHLAALDLQQQCQGRRHASTHATKRHTALA